MKLLYQSFDSPRRFGVEMEVNGSVAPQNLSKAISEYCGFANSVVGWHYTIDNQRWEVKPDSTCGDTGRKQDGGGYEAVSPPGHGANHLAAVGSVADALKKIGAKTNDHCGFHCQVEIKDFNDTMAATVGAYWCQLEKVISQMVPPHRTGRGGKYCRLLTKKYTFRKKSYTASEFWATIQPNDLGPPGKRTAISFINYMRAKSGDYQWEAFANRRTVELRLPESSLLSNDTKNWARFFVHFVETSSKKAFPHDISFVGVRDALSIMGLDSSSHPIILSPGLYETKIWVLNRILRFGQSPALCDEARRILAEIILDDSSPYDPESLI